ncbi:MAG: hypothetical protein R6X25_07720 [Candidatus Krumholzibacteriia bacterium]
MRPAAGIRRATAEGGRIPGMPVAGSIAGVVAGVVAWLVVALGTAPSPALAATTSGDPAMPVRAPAPVATAAADPAMVDPVASDDLPASRGSGTLRHVGRPAERHPVHLIGDVSVGSGLAHALVRPGLGAGFLFRPAAADHFLAGLYRRNTALLLQAEYRRMGSDRRLLSADIILRPYLRDARTSGREMVPFVGLGLGAGEGTVRAAGGATRRARGLSVVAEAGLEWRRRDGLLLSARGQVRIFDHEGLDYSGWSFHGALGVPLPW